MNGVTPQLAALAISTGIGVWMAVVGVHKNALEWKRRQRVCPSCGHVISGRTCTRHV